MRYLSLFSGIGGFELGIQQAYELQEMGIESKDSTDDTSSTSQYSERPLCVGYSEIDKYAVQIYEKHFPYEQCEACREYLQEQSRDREGLRPIGNKPDSEVSGAKSEPICDESKNNCQCKHKNYGDITQLDPTTLPNFDLLVGGVPCQSWSIAGKRGGFEDERGNMWFQFSRILRAKQPKYFLAENVKGLLSHDGGKSMERICEELCDCGYAIDFEILNAKDFGVPQNRERVFIIGIRLDLLDKCQIF